MNHWKVQNPRQDLSYEIAFTQAYRAALKRYTHPAEIELAMLRAQYPAIMHPIEDNDVLAGRVEFGLVGYGIQGQTGGTGYYIDEPRVVQALEFAEGNAKYREDLHDMLTFWKARNTYNKVLRETPAELRAAIPTEQWKTEPVAASPISRMAGAYIDFDKLVRVGVPGLRAELTALLDTAPAAGRDEVLLRCALGALDVLCGMLRFYETQAREKAADAPTPARRKEMEDLAAALHELPERAPTSLLAAMQLCWLYGVMCPLVEFGRMDEYLGDLYCHDIDNGVITEAQALKMAQTYFYLIDALDDETDGRVIVGGYGRRNPE